MSPAFIVFHLPPAFLHIFLVCALETSLPSEFTQWCLPLPKAAGARATANAAMRAIFMVLLLQQESCVHDSSVAADARATPPADRRAAVPAGRAAARAELLRRGPRSALLAAAHRRQRRAFPD